MALPSIPVDHIFLVADTSGSVMQKTVAAATFLPLRTHTHRIRRRMRIKIKVDGVSSISPENPSRVDPKWQLLQT